jgi:hypothetical protein
MYDLLRLLGSRGGIASDFPKCSGGDEGKRLVRSPTSPASRLGSATLNV